MEFGFIGLGRMGSGMARNLLRAGHKVTVYNRSAERSHELARDGAAVADTAASAARCQLVLSMLADDAAVEQVVFGERGIAQALEPGGIHVCHATISTALARRLATEHAARHQVYISAPVFGRPEAAASAQLLVMTGGPADTIERCRPAFDAIGHKTVIIGTEPWQANAVKICGNFMLCSMIESYGEALAVIRKSGVDPAAFVQIMGGLFRSPVYDNYGGIIASQKFEPAGFALRLGLKDARLMLATADESETPAPVAGVIHNAMLAAVAAGMGEMDWSVVSRIAARNAGLDK